MNNRILTSGGRSLAPAAALLALLTVSACGQSADTASPAASLENTATKTNGTATSEDDQQVAAEMHNRMSAEAAANSSMGAAPGGMADDQMGAGSGMGGMMDGHMAMGKDKMGDAKPGMAKDSMGSGGTMAKPDPKMDKPMPAEDDM